MRKFQDGFAVTFTVFMQKSACPPALLPEEIRAMVVGG